MHLFAYTIFQPSILRPVRRNWPVPAGERSVRVYGALGVTVAQSALDRVLLGQLPCGSGAPLSALRRPRFAIQLLPWLYVSNFHADAGDAGNRGAVVVDQPAGELIKIGSNLVSYDATSLFSWPRPQCLVRCSARFWLIAPLRRRPRQCDRQTGSDMILDLIDHDGRGAP